MNPRDIARNSEEEDEEGEEEEDPGASLPQGRCVAVQPPRRPIREGQSHSHLFPLPSMRDRSERFKRRAAAGGPVI